MSTTIALLGTALWIGTVHTLLGPDHYIPFVAMARAGGWSKRKTLLVTLVCGIGHVASSVALGLIGILVGAVLFRLESIEAWRGDVAGWLMLGFGLAYFVWGVVRAIRNLPHHHWHRHPEGTHHSHEQPSSAKLTPWILFTIFLFGPCEPLIPILMYPAAHANLSMVFLVTAAFGIATIATMTSVVALLTAGVGACHWRGLDRYSHAAAGLAIAGCGFAVKFGL